MSALSRLQNYIIHHSDIGLRSTDIKKTHNKMMLMYWNDRIDFVDDYDRVDVVDF